MKNMSCKKCPKTINDVVTLFKDKKAALICTCVFSILEAIIISIVTFLVCLAYNNYLIQSKELIQNEWAKYLLLCVLIICLFIFTQLVFIVHNIWVAKASEKIMYGIRRSTLKKLHLMPINFFNTTSSGEIMTRIGSDIDNMSQFTSRFFSTICFYTSLAICSVLMIFFINWFLALVTLLIVIVIALCNKLIIWKTSSSFKNKQESIAQLNGFAEEMLSGVKTVSLFKMNKKVANRFDNLNKKVAEHTEFAQTASNMIPLNRILTRLIIFVVVALCIGIIAFKTPTTHSWLLDQCIFPKSWFRGVAISKPTLIVFFTMFALNLTESINNLTVTKLFSLSAISSAKHLFKLLAADEEKDLESASNITEVLGKIEAKDLIFSYDKNTQVLKKINFVIEPGQKIAIVGPSGSGKSTIINLLNKFIEPTSGDLLIDDKSIKNITAKSLRENVSIVTKDTYIFNQSIKDNIRYGRPSATNDEVIAAAKAANLHDFVMSLPKGYNTILTDNGSNISAGQKQLISMARAFLSNPRIVLLDEPLSIIDTNTQQDMDRGISKLTAKKTTLFVTHSISSIVKADKILVLRNGKLIASGTHQELLAKNKFYAKLFNSEFNLAKDYSYIPYW